MVQNNKVLTVSYGTFSCTLEGFDDSFGTMKAIAEYFRDLASDDRYFGAEPPQPDADMLARIAQREISRQVEARTDQKHIVLRAAETETAATPSEPAPQPTPAPQPEMKATPQPVVPPQQAPVVAPTPIAAAVEPAAVQTAAPEPVAEALKPTPRPVVVAEPVAEPEIVPAADSIAAKLKRIREVVSNADQETSDLAFSEDEHAGDATPVVGTIEEAFAGDVKSAEAFMSLSSDTAEDQFEDEGAAEPVMLTPAPVESLFQGSGDHAKDNVEDETADEAEDDNALFGDLDDEEGDDLSAEDDLSNILMSDEDPEEIEPAPIHVLRVSADAPAAQADDTSGDLDFASALSADDEADLLRELAEVEAELKGAASDNDPATEAPEVSVEHVSLPPVTDDSGEDNLSRLMAAADERLDNPDSSTSRDTYSHLRAAAAAAEAERPSDKEPEQPEESDSLVENLSKIVRPRRPVLTESAPRERTGNDRPAPLKLVAEQRVDLSADAGNSGPVLPRRVATVVTEEPESETSGFEKFTAENGAVSLPDLLEAAAAYMSFVEGREQFSRPQLMNKVRQLDNQEFNREDGLRSFGQLLRDGKIEKTSGGRFTASGEIGFRPDNRAAG